MLESGAERSALGASLRGADSSSRRWLEFCASVDLTAEQMNRAPSPHPISYSKPVSIFTSDVCFRDLTKI